MFRSKTTRQRKTASTAITTILSLALLAMASTAQAGVDRYGGVWHEGVANGLFVPLTTGMTYNGLQSYRSSWEDYRLIDFELVALGCPAESTDLFASKWEEGNWKDILEFYYDLSDFENTVVDLCEEGFKLIDFEVWDTACSEEPVRYVALYSDKDGCDPEPSPAIHSSLPYDFESVVQAENGAGYEAVDFETDNSLNPGSILGVFYAGTTPQTFGIFDRPDFEQEMQIAEGDRLLDDMESYLELPEWPRNAGPTRKVAGLWNEELGARDDHEVGEVLPKFKKLLYKDPATRRLADLEVHPNTFDRRFHEVFESYLGQNPVGWGLSVRQLGEDVGSTGGGLATRPDPVKGLNAIPMTHQTPAVTASVTKFVTAVGVVAYAETQNQPNQPDWLDKYLVDILPSDFFLFGNGVNQIKIRHMLTQRTGLSNFSTTIDPKVDPAGYRAATVAWLQQPVMTSLPAGFNYQNAHFDVLALAMAEIVASQYPTSPDPWREWVNDNVLSKLGIGNRGCGFQSSYARTYPLLWSTEHATWADPGYPCDGEGTGSTMWFLSADDMARLAWGVREAIVVDAIHSAEFFDQGLGLDFSFGAAPYGPSWDSTPGTLGEEIHSKNGGLGTGVNGEIVGLETLLAFYDDKNFDDDAFNMSEYSYEIGATEFDVGITIQAASIATNDPCVPTNSCTSADRGYPAGITMMLEAFRQPEKW